MRLHVPNKILGASLVAAYGVLTLVTSGSATYAPNPAPQNSSSQQVQQGMLESIATRVAANGTAIAANGNAISALSTAEAAHYAEVKKELYGIETVTSRSAPSTVSSAATATPTPAAQATSPPAAAKATVAPTPAAQATSPPAAAPTARPTPIPAPTSKPRVSVQINGAFLPGLGSSRAECDDSIGKLCAGGYVTGTFLDNNPQYQVLQISGPNGGYRIVKNQLDSIVGGIEPALKDHYSSPIVPLQATEVGNFLRGLVDGRPDNGELTHLVMYAFDFTDGKSGVQAGVNYTAHNGRHVLFVAIKPSLRKVIESEYALITRR